MKKWDSVVVHILNKCSDCGRDRFLLAYFLLFVFPEPGREGGETLFLDVICNRVRIPFALLDEK